MSALELYNEKTFTQIPFAVARALGFVYDALIAGRHQITVDEADLDGSINKPYLVTPTGLQTADITLYHVRGIEAEVLDKVLVLINLAEQAGMYQE